MIEYLEDFTEEELKDLPENQKDILLKLQEKSKNMDINVYHMTMDYLRRKLAEYKMKTK